MTQPLVAVLMGSRSDLAIMEKTASVLDEFGVRHEVRVLSAHRSPGALDGYVKQAASAGVEVFICGAGMAAHLAGAVAARTTLPVIGVPLSATLGGLDALLSTVQMPPGVPVATVGVDGAKNAAYLAISILALKRPELAEKLRVHRERTAAEAGKEAAVPGVESHDRRPSRPGDPAGPRGPKEPGSSPRGGSPS